MLLARKALLSALCVGLHNACHPEPGASPSIPPPSQILNMPCPWSWYPFPGSIGSMTHDLLRTRCLLAPHILPISSLHSHLVGLCIPQGMVISICSTMPSCLVEVKTCKLRSQEKRVMTAASHTGWTQRPALNSRKQGSCLTFDPAATRFDARR